MVQLTTVIQSSNLIERFNDFVATTANANIVWGTDARPFTEFTSAYLGYDPLGGAKAGMGKKPTTFATPADDPLKSGAGGVIEAQALFDTLTAWTEDYTRIRSLHAELYVNASGGYPYNRGTRAGPGGTVFNQTKIAHMSSAYEQAVTLSAEEGSGDVITKAGVQGGVVPLTLTGPTGGSVPNPSGYVGQALTGLLKSCQDAYKEARLNTYDITVTVCHASCHYSCHGSRSRR